MAYRYQQHIYSPSFNEAAYRALKARTAAHKEGLSTEELKIFKDDYTLKKYCNEERMDHILYIMTKTGKSWTLRIEEDETSADLIEFNTKDQYRYPQKRVDITEATAREGVCVISSREVMVLSHMTAQNCTTKVYAISDFTKGLQQKGKDLNTLRNWDDQVKKAEGAYDTFNNLLLEQLNSFDYSKETIGLDENDLRILAALFKTRNSAITMKQITELTKAKGRKMYFRKNIEKLLKENLIYSDEKSIKRIWANSCYFMITTKGIDTIMKYSKYVYKNSFGII